MEFQINNDKANGTVSISGPLDISNVMGLKDALLDSFEESDNVVFVANGSDDVSFASLQLLCSACGTAAKKGKKFMVTGEDASALEGAIEVSGFKSQGCGKSGEDCSLWFVGDTGSDGGKNQEA